MIKHIKAQVKLTLATMAIGAVGYPLVVLAIGQGLFPDAANGSLIKDGDRVIGSRLIAQQTAGDLWFHPRPSAVDYNAAASGGSNFGANNPKLGERVKDAVKHQLMANAIPADAVTTSGSGLDPYITVKNAQRQMNRIVAAWAKKTNSDPIRIRQMIESIVNQKAIQPFSKEQIVNVMELNQELVR